MVRALASIAGLSLLAACVTVPEAPHAPDLATRAEAEDLAFQMALLRADIARLRHDVCVLAVQAQLVEVRRDPANGRNRVMARDGAIQNPERVCPS